MSEEKQVDWGEMTLIDHEIKDLKDIKDRLLYDIEIISGRHVRTPLESSAYYISFKLREVVKSVDIFISEKLQAKEDIWAEEHKRIEWNLKVQEEKELVELKRLKEKYEDREIT